MKTILAAAIIALTLSGHAQADGLAPCNDITTEHLLSLFQSYNNGMGRVFDLIGDIKGPNGRNECSVHLMTEVGEFKTIYTRFTVNNSVYVRIIRLLRWTDDGL